MRIARTCLPPMRNLHIMFRLIICFLQSISEISRSTTYLIYLTPASFKLNFHSHFYTIHSCIACSSTPTARRISCSCSRSESSAHQASPQPAEICLGTGISLPGAFWVLQAFSIAMASAVVWNVTTSFNVFFRIIRSRARVPYSIHSLQKQNSAVSFPPVLLSP